MRFPAAALLLVLATAADAADHPVAGDLLRLRDAAGVRRVRFRAGREAALAAQPATDPRAAGATLAVTGGPGEGTSGTLGLPAALWRGLGSPPGRAGFRYLDRGGSGGIRKVVLRLDAAGGTLIVAGGGSGWPYRLEGPQSAVDLRFQVGGDLYCARFATFEENRRGHLLARRAPAPAACTMGPPPPACGNGVVESGEECDDGNAAAGDGCSDLCLTENLPCGNGVLDPGEECDDGARQPADGCSTSCQLEGPAGACAGVPGEPGVAVTTALVAEGLDSPVHVAAAPTDPRRLFVVEQTGRVRLVKDGLLLATPFLDIADKVSCCGEQGLLSIAFHPDYEQNGRFFVAYTDTAGDDVVARYRASALPDLADAASEQILISVPDFAANHNGGQLAFGPDRYLYVSLGDGGGGGDPQETGQDGARLLGKILRLDVDVDEAPFHAAPPTNPFSGPGDPLDEIWALGLRNPWRMSFDRLTGDLYIGDVGQGAWEEIDVQPGTSPGGENYGWDVFEGNHCYEPTPPAASCPAPPTGFTFPVVEYSHGEGCSVTGGVVYRGCALPDLRGTYFYSDFCTAFIRTFRGVAGGRPLEEDDLTAELAPGGGRAIDNVSSFGEDARGEVHIADYDGEIWKIVPRP